MDDVSRFIKDNLRYVQERSGTYTLFHSNVYTGISVSRSHEGYNHFACWYIKFHGKIKQSYGVKEREEALQAGYFLFYEMLAEKMQEIKEREGKK